MILDSKHTTVAYRCPHCGAGVISAVNVFSLSADMVKLKCTCGKSEMSIVSSQDEKIRLTVPCMLCATPHIFTVNSSLFYGKEIFSLCCPYASDFPLAFFGEMNLVKGELARSELALLDMMEKNGLTPPEEIIDDEDVLPDPAPSVVLTEITDSALIYGVRIWCPGSKYWDTRFALNRSIKLAFDENGIIMPHQQVDVHVQEKQA